MNRSETIASLAAALVQAQAEFPAIPRGKEVEVFSKRTQQKYRFRYAPFEDILRATKEARLKNGLAFTQSATQSELLTTILHASGEFWTSAVPLVISEAGAQAMGSAITYSRRYGFCEAFGIQADDDDDGNAADGNAIAESKSVISGAQVCKDSFDAQPQDVKDWLQLIASDVRTMIGKDDVEGAYNHLEAQKLDADNKAALWSLLDSKQRSAIKKHGEQRRAA